MCGATVCWESIRWIQPAQRAGQSPCRHVTPTQGDDVRFECSCPCGRLPLCRSVDPRRCSVSALQGRAVAPLRSTSHRARECACSFKSSRWVFVRVGSVRSLPWCSAIAPAWSSLFSAPQVASSENRKAPRACGHLEAFLSLLGPSFWPGAVNWSSTPARTSGSRLADGV